MQNRQKLEQKLEQLKKEINHKKRVIEGWDGKYSGITPFELSLLFAGITKIDTLKDNISSLVDAYHDVERVFKRYRLLRTKDYNTGSIIVTKDLLFSCFVYNKPPEKETNVIGKIKKDDDFIIDSDLQYFKELFKTEYGELTATLQFRVPETLYNIDPSYYGGIYKI